MARASLYSIADGHVLYLTTIGRTTGLPREIEIWFVVCRERFYLFAETGEAAGWVKHIRRKPRVTLRIGERQIDATARVLDRQTDRKLWDQVAAIGVVAIRSLDNYEQQHRRKSRRITGASSGLGEATARLLSAQGAIISGEWNVRGT